MSNTKFNDSADGLHLTPAEASLIRDFRCLAKSQSEVIALTVCELAKERRQTSQVKPTLRLVKGGAL